MGTSDVSPATDLVRPGIQLRSCDFGPLKSFLDLEASLSHGHRQLHLPQLCDVVHAVGAVLALQRVREGPGNQLGKALQPVRTCAGMSMQYTFYAKS